MILYKKQLDTFDHLFRYYTYGNKVHISEIRNGLKLNMLFYNITYAK